eukprot:TRINITY_DN1814_c0_g1_i1.p1 TRINITY_DN1814_c0_g1~~TRINITY_DN1814_c0_g1_i1.p1  ORF type:complete len:2509 (+),score=641.73 TRINITY_DN1814_c0_g1_i1:27-7553(+)
MSKLNKQEILRLIKDLENPQVGVEFKDRRVMGKKVPNCFTGKELVDWIVDRRYADSRDAAIELSKHLIQDGYIEHLSKGATQVKDDSLLKIIPSPSKTVIFASMVKDNQLFDGEVEFRFGENDLIITIKEKNEEITFPHWVIGNIVRKPQTNQNSSPKVVICCKNFQIITVQFVDNDEMNKFYNTIDTSLVQSKSNDYLELDDLPFSNKWDANKFRSELKRQGFFPNADLIYQIKGEDLVLPQLLDPQDVHDLRRARVKGGLPNYTWGCWNHELPQFGCSIFLSSRPKIGYNLKEDNAQLMSSGSSGSSYSSLNSTAALPNSVQNTSSANSSSNEHPLHSAVSFRKDQYKLGSMYASYITSEDDQDVIAAHMKDVLLTEMLTVSINHPSIMQSLPSGTSKRQRNITVLDTGTSNQALTEAYPHLKWRFLGLSSVENEDKMIQLLNICNSPISDFDITINSIKGLSGPLIKRYLYGAWFIYNVLIRGDSLILQTGNFDSSSSSSPIVSTVPQGYNSQELKLESFGSSRLTSAHFPRIILSSIAQVMIDPYYRTIDGFFTLISKEWRISGESMWIHFNIFITCVYQLLVLHPTLFEYTEGFLFAVLDHVQVTLDEFKKNVLSVIENNYFRNENTEVLDHSVLEDIQWLPDKTDDDDSGGKKGSRFNPYVWLSYYLRHNPTVVSEHNSVISILSQADGSNPTSLTIKPQSSSLSLVSSRVPLQATTSRDVKIISKKLIWFPENAYLESNSLFLRSCQLHSLPQNMQNFPNLRQMILDENLFEMIPRVLGLIQSLTSVSLCKNKITRLSPVIPRINKIQELLIDHNDVVSLDDVSQFSDLRTLSVRGNKIRVIPLELQNLSNLTCFKISGNLLTQFPSIIFSSLSKIQIFHVSENSLAVLPDLCFEYWKDIHTLNLANNKLSFLPRSLGNCRSLTFLDVSSNNITKMPPEMSHLGALKYLNFSSNQLIEIPFWIHRLVSLQTLDISKNKIREISNSLCQMKWLEDLNLSGNSLVSLPATLGALDKLRTLDVRENKNLNFPPPNIVSQGPQAILTFLNDILKKTKKVLRVKLMVFGKTKVGKSVLVENLGKQWTDQPLPSDSEGQIISNTPKFNNNSMTEGVSIKTFNFFREPIKDKQDKRLLRKSRRHMIIDTWDMSGEDIYFSSHQLFLSSRAIYLIVFSLVDTGAEKQIIYWLRSIIARVHQPKVIIVGTHLDLYMKARGLSTTNTSTTNTQNAPVFDAKQLSVEYLSKISNLTSSLASLAFYSVNTMSEEDLAELRDNIEEEILSDSTLVKDLPFSYSQLELLMKERAQSLDVPIINQQELMKMGAACNMNQKRDILQCTRLLHDLSTIIYFDKMSHLSDIVILNPQWLVKMLASIYSAKNQFLKKNGVVDESDLLQIWSQYPASIHKQLLHVLEKFDLAFTLKESSASSALTTDVDPITPSSHRVKRNESDGDLKQILITPLLPETRPDETIETIWKKLSSLKKIKRIYRFAFLPTGLFFRVITRTLQMAEKRIMTWASGVCVMSRSVIVFVEQRHTDNTNQQDELIIELRSNIELNMRTILYDVLDFVLYDIIEANDLECEGYAIYTPPTPGSGSTTSTPQTPLTPSSLHNSSLNVMSVLSMIPAPSSDPPPLSLTVSMAEIEKAIHENKNTITVHNYTITLSDVAPDVALPEFTGARVVYSQIKIDKLLGTGGFAKVYLTDISQNSSLTDKYATKVLIDKTKPLHVRDFKHEIRLQGTLDHPNIVKIYAICYEPLSSITELCPHGDLFTFLSKWNESLPWLLRLHFLTDIAKALHYMQKLSPPMAHLDLKSPNIMIKSLDHSSPVCAKLADFGTSQYVKEPITIRKVDNPTWLAPEILKSQPYDHKSDTYAFGVIAWEILTRKPYFGNAAFFTDVQDSIVGGERELIPEFCDGNYRQIIRRCWHQQPEFRPSFDWVIATLDRIRCTLLTEFEHNLIVYDDQLKTSYILSEKDNNISSSPPPNPPPPEPKPVPVNPAASSISNLSNITNISVGVSNLSSSSPQSQKFQSASVDNLQPRKADSEHTIFAPTRANSSLFLPRSVSGSNKISRNRSVPANRRVSLIDVLDSSESLTRFSKYLEKIGAAIILSVYEVLCKLELTESTTQEEINSYQQKIVLLTDVHNFVFNTNGTSSPPSSPPSSSTSSSSPTSSPQQNMIRSNGGTPIVDKAYLVFRALAYTKDPNIAAINQVKMDLNIMLTALVAAWRSEESQARESEKKVLFSGKKKSNKSADKDLQPISESDSKSTKRRSDSSSREKKPTIRSKSLKNIHSVLSIPSQGSGGLASYREYQEIQLHNVLADPELYAEFERFLKAFHADEVLRLYNSIISYQEQKFSSNESMISAAKQIGVYLGIPDRSTSVVPMEDCLIIDLQDVFTKQGTNQQMFSDVAIELKSMLRPRMVSFNSSRRSNVKDKDNGGHLSPKSKVSSREFGLSEQRSPKNNSKIKATSPSKKKSKQKNQGQLSSPSSPSLALSGKLSLKKKDDEKS